MVYRWKEKKMNSRQYEKMMTEIYKATLGNAGINEGEYTSVCLSADRTEYEVTLIDGSIVVVPSGFEYTED
jgi:hypothetical protein